MMNAATFLVLAVHEIAISAKLAIAAGAAEKPDTYTLTYRPSLDTGANSINQSDNFMAWDARPIAFLSNFIIFLSDSLAAKNSLAGQERNERREVQDFQP
jgi:hypothetical protein